MTAPLATRRGFITGLVSFVAAPAIVRAGSLMPAAGEWVRRSGVHDAGLWWDNSLSERVFKMWIARGCRFSEIRASYAIVFDKAKLLRSTSLSGAA